MLKSHCRALAIVVLLVFSSLYIYLLLIPGLNASNGSSDQEFYWEIESSYNDFYRPSFTMVQNYIITINRDFIKNESYFIIDKNSRELTRIKTGDQYPNSFSPILLARNIVNNDFPNVCIIFDNYSRILMINSSNYEIIKYGEGILLSSKYYVKGMAFDGQYIYCCVEKKADSSYYLEILDLNFNIMSEYYLGSSENYSFGKMIVQPNILMIIMKADYNTALNDELLIFNITDVGNIPLKFSCENEINGAILLEDKQILYILSDFSIQIINLTKNKVIFQKIGYFDLNFLGSMTKLDNIEHDDNIILFSFKYDSKIHFMEIKNATNLSYLGYISGLALSNQLNFEVFAGIRNKTGKIIVSTYFDLIIIQYDLETNYPSIYEQYGIEIGNALPIICVIGVAALGILYFQNKNKK